MSLLKRGDQIGDWIVVDELGEGGMGAVYRCHNTLSTKIGAAVKVLKPHGLGKARERFLREVELLASVQHPAVVRVLGGGEDTKRGLLYMAMELLNGEELADRLERGPLEWDEACRIFHQLGAGLLAAHEKGVVHRDIKPQNILLCDDGTAKLLDFGIAIQTGGEKLTREGQVPGTVSYMAPEVFEGKKPDHRADIYALGLLLWEALTGKEAYPEDPTTTQQQNIVRIMGEKLRSESLDPGGKYPRGVRDLIARCTIPEPERRLSELTLFVKVLETGGDSTGDLKLEPQGRRRSGVWLAVALVGLLAVVVLGGGGLLLVGGIGAWMYSNASSGPAAFSVPTTASPSFGTYASPKFTAELPEGFPFELPPDANIVSATKATTGGMPYYTVSALTQEDPRAVAARFDETFKGRGLETMSSEMTDANGVTLSVVGWSMKENATFSIGPSYGMGEGKLITLTWVPQP
ncbi:MAG: serine/threonine protein kinase [Deltaproteobacteria bacterium]|nr:serine/threonine protein kinase [Deltaproteobacteria bacterium]